VVELRPDEPLRFERASGTVTELAFEVAADQFVHLEVQQGATDVSATVIDPTGAVVKEVDALDMSGVIESISWTRSRPGRYTLRIRVKNTVADGFFDVLLERPRPSGVSDDEWLRCERTLVAVLSHSQPGRAAHESNAMVLRQAPRGLARPSVTSGGPRSRSSISEPAYHEGDAERGSTIAWRPQTTPSVPET
jgi:hypothetical protein